MPYRILQLFFAFCVVIVILFGDLSAIAVATTLDFRWEGEKGYSVQGSLTYAEDKEPVERSNAKKIESLTVSIYNPSGKKIKTYENIKHYFSQNSYLQLDFDSKNHKIDGFIDLGGNSAGEMYLKGIVDQNLALFKIDSSGKEQIYDQNSGYIEQVKF